MSQYLSVTGGDKWEKYIRDKYQPNSKPDVKVGVLEGATYSKDHQPDYFVNSTDKNGNTRRIIKKGTPRTYIPKIVEVAFWNEFGTKNAPARSFLRSTLDDKKQEWVLQFYKLVQTMSVKNALESLGDIMVADVRDTIKSGVGPALSEITIERRKANKINGVTPLMASREMLNAISFEITN